MEIVVLMHSMCENFMDSEEPQFPCMKNLLWFMEFYGMFLYSRWF